MARQYSSAVFTPLITADDVMVAPENGLYLVVGLGRGLGHGELLRELFLELSREGGLHGLRAPRPGVSLWLSILMSMTRPSLLTPTTVVMRPA